MSSTLARVDRSHLQITGSHPDASICNRSSRQLCTSQPDLAPVFDSPSDSAEDAHISQPTGARALTSRQVAALSPRLGVLNNIPFAIPFATRFRILRAFVDADRASHAQGGEDPPDIRRPWSVVGGMPQRASVRRGHIAEDGFDKLGEADLKGHVQIAFIDQFGDVEYVPIIDCNVFAQLIEATAQGGH